MLSELVSCCILSELLSFTYLSLLTSNMKTINGYSMAVLLCQFFSDVWMDIPFPKLCLLFGPLFWKDGLSPLEKQYFKRLAAEYKQSPTGIAEKNGHHPTRDEFLTAVFGLRTQEQYIVQQKLEPVAAKIRNMSIIKMNELIARAHSAGDIE